ncbi:MAG: hypothetical protein KME03_20110 [Aphanocapsa lilacina HA4352-LM1]|jgi:hypothetical protein|nr:hypothetical protein [Aphanocapsa lilacina HA4352-LM1]
MAILIANLGVSDLSIKVGEHFFPIDVRDEPNVPNIPKWNERSKQVKDFLEKELRIKLDQKEYFRALTKRLNEAFIEDPPRWEELVRSSRIEGVINKALAFQELKIDKVHVFVTDQATEENPNYHGNDTVYLFDTLKRWFARNYPSLSFEKYPLRDLNPTNLDALFDFYRNYFEGLPGDEDEIVLVSIKGGTPQMQNALRIQSLASGLRRLLFLEPEFSAEKVMAGEPSDCKITSYWRFVRNQKHLTINQLLSRWDFGGANEIWNEWNKDLDWITKYVSDAPSQQRQTIAEVLKCARLLLCLDSKKALQTIQNNETLRSCPGLESIAANKYDALKDLYAQAKMKFDTQEVADSLWRMSTFCELLLKELAISCTNRLFSETIVVEDKGWLYLLVSKAKPEMVDLFSKMFRINLPVERYKLKDRDMHNLIDVLINHGNGNEDVLVRVKSGWTIIKKHLAYLDNWDKKRNELVHAGRGYAIEPSEEKKILQSMADLYVLAAGIAVLNPEVMFDPMEYYVYSSIRDWVREQLNQNGQHYRHEAGSLSLGAPGRYGQLTVPCSSNR